MPKLTCTDDDITRLSQAITDMATLWDIPMSEKRLGQYLYTLTVQNTTIPFEKLMHSIALARMQDHTFPMPADILQRELRH